ncbi:MAG: hypothetical protein RLZZ70_769 [Candidatus Parcubacteria bacterium]|jgi:hypothetical protein
MDNFYQYGLPQPFHISVGGVLFNEDYEICVHHFHKRDISPDVHFLMDNLDDVWHLMRESLEGNESLHDAVLRGMQEEFGLVGAVDKYLGSKIDIITGPNQVPFEKLTIYHAVKLVSFADRPSHDEENKSVMEWYIPRNLIAIFDAQCAKTQRPELDERIIIERFISAYALN